MNQIEEEKKQIAVHIQANVDRVALPLFELLEEKIDPTLLDYIKLIKHCVQDLTSPYVNRLETKYNQLTAREIEICKMIKNGFSSKQIARIMNIAEQTVIKRRKIIRKKLGIANKNINLGSLLKNIG